MLGLEVLRTGTWNMTLRDYSQTTRIKRNGSGVDVHVEVDHIGDMDVHVGNLLRGRSVMGKKPLFFGYFIYWFGKYGLKNYIDGPTSRQTFWTSAHCSLVQQKS